ncbi:DUF1064 domain-containing protein [Pandoraea apista]|uniref:DUF1064 domain-containing protein n=1 Tax=Pandoraea apista TaxID=93218 RepID=UPI001EE61BA3|nr:DUF1064 domain-containing protein [Pandoraea apista]
MSANTLRWTEEQLAAHQKRTAEPARAGLAEGGEATTLPVATGTVREPDMNKTEAEYAQMLEARRVSGEILWWAYEAMTLKLADNTRYTPDFLVMLADGALEVHETKGGFIREDGWLKLKVAAGMFPFRFFLCQKQAKKAGGGWTIRRV